MDMEFMESSTKKMRLLGIAGFSPFENVITSDTLNSKEKNFKISENLSEKIPEKKAKIFLSTVPKKLPKNIPKTILMNILPKSVTLF